MVEQAEVIIQEKLQEQAHVEYLPVQVRVSAEPPAENRTKTENQEPSIAICL
jgi:hypothetical protein